MRIGSNRKRAIFSRILLTLPFFCRLLDCLSYTFQVWMIRILFFYPASGAVPHSSMINIVAGSATDSAYRAFPIAKESGHVYPRTGLPIRLTDSVDD
ncbi:MAG: hypothetical protein CMB75_03080 [Euryarchaeota archaeon]|nr:hypothetical protein [Euryarchaeota archaeon]